MNKDSSRVIRQQTAYRVKLFQAKKSHRRQAAQVVAALQAVVAVAQIQRAQKGKQGQV